MLGCDKVGLSGIFTIFTKSYSINMVRVYSGIISYCRFFWVGLLRFMSKVPVLGGARGVALGARSRFFWGVYCNLSAVSGLWALFLLRHDKPIDQ